MQYALRRNDDDGDIWRYANMAIHGEMVTISQSLNSPPPPPTRVHKHKTQSLPTHTPPPHVHKITTTKQALPQNAHVQASTTNKPHATKFCNHPYAYQYQRGHLISNCLRTRVHKLTTTKPFPKTPTYTHPPLKSHTPQLLPILPLSTTPFHHPPPPPHTTSTTHIPYDTTRSQPCTIYDHIS